jgi:hypothetical protein
LLSNLNSVQKGDNASGSQPAPIWLKESLVPYKNAMREIHVAGMAILPKRVLNVVNGDTRSLHEVF